MLKFIIYLKIILICAGTILGIGVGIYIYNLIRQYIAKNPLNWKNPFTLSNIENEMNNLSRIIPKYDYSVGDKISTTANSMKLQPTSLKVIDPANIYRKSTYMNLYKVADTKKTQKVVVKTVSDKLTKLTKVKFKL